MGAIQIDDYYANPHKYAYFLTNCEQSQNMQNKNHRVTFAQLITLRTVRIQRQLRLDVATLFA